MEDKKILIIEKKDKDGVFLDIDDYCLVDNFLSEIIQGQDEKAFKFRTLTGNLCPLRKIPSFKIKIIGNRQNNPEIKKLFDEKLSG
jgi:hypothetical protein